jgi:tetratricopeptide (TPR) repeat protein
MAASERTDAPRVVIVADPGLSHDLAGRVADGPRLEPLPGRAVALPADDRGAIQTLAGLGVNALSRTGSAHRNVSSVDEPTLLPCDMEAVHPMTRLRIDDGGMDEATARPVFEPLPREVGGQGNGGGSSPWGNRRPALDTDEMDGGPFVGRADELDKLGEWADEVGRTGVGRFVLLVGVAGMGKTTLCEEFLRRRGGRVPTAWSRCWDEGGGPPLWPWPDVIAELGAEPDHPQREGLTWLGQDRFEVFRGVIDRLRKACVAGPCTVLIDDLHAASHDVGLLTRFVARSVHRFPLLLVATWRIERPASDEVTAGLEALARDATVLELGPFGLQDLDAYVRLNGERAPTAASVRGLLNSTGGNPMYVAELVNSASDRDLPDLGLVGALERRVAGLGQEQRRIVGAAAVLGSGTTVAELAEVLRCAQTTVVQAIDDLASGATLAGSEIRFSHALLREAFARSVPGPERLQFHVSAVRTIVGLDTDHLVRRARHAIEAATISPEHTSVAVEASVDAIDSLVRALAFEQAGELAAAACALPIGLLTPAAEASIRLAHARTVLMCGRLGEAHELFDRAVDPAERSGDARLLATAALGLAGLWVEEQREELPRRRLLALCRRALAGLPADEVVLAGRLRVRLAAEDAYGGRPADDVVAAVDQVRRSGDPAALAEALSVLHHTMLGPEYASERLAVVDELLDAAARADGTIHSLSGLCWRTVDLYLLGSRHAERSFVELRDRAEALGGQAIVYIVAVMEVMRTFRRGELERAAQLAEEALVLGLKAGDADALPYYGGHLLAIDWVHGRTGEVRELVASVRESSVVRRRDVVYDAVYALSSAMDGDHATARTVLDGIRVGGLAGIGVPSNRTTTWMILVETAAELRDAELAAELAEVFEPYAHRPVMPSLAVTCLGPGQRVMGVACGVAGRIDEAVDWFRAALDANVRLRNAPVDAIIRAELAGALRTRGVDGDQEEAAQLYASAIALGAALGLTDRVEEWSRAAGALRSSHPAPPVHRQGTMQELPDGWRIEIDDRSVQVGRLVGMRHIAALLARPDTDLRANELAAVVDGSTARADAMGTPAIDTKARRDYRRRIGELDHELDLADMLGDADRGRRAAEERQAIIDVLRRDTGLGGRPRRMSDDADRSRMRVSKAIHRAIQRVGEADPVIGHTLENRIRTGYVCRYAADPGAPIDWTIETGPT